MNIIVTNVGHYLRMTLYWNLTNCLGQVERWCLGYPGATCTIMASQPRDRILPPWLANPRNPAMSPHSKPKGLSELPTPVWRGKEGLRAGGSPGPELPKS